jgi:pimeloyl-ACP methyl ester carboxylesterase
MQPLKPRFERVSDVNSGNQEILRIFIHGLESTNQGTKSVFFRERFPDMITPNFPGSLEERMIKLESILDGKEAVRMVGSSFGGLMAAIYAMENSPRIARLILLAPAINLMEPELFPQTEIMVPTWIYHGKEDEVIPLAAVEKVANRVFRNLTLHAVDDDHYLHRTFKTLDWDMLLS